MIDLPGLKTATLDTYTCTIYGYTEFYADQLGLENIKSSGRFLSKISDRVDYSTRWCSDCGSSIPPEEKFCPKCGKQLNW
ncbi:MAG: zinc-ribbon domain-containing protein [Candidatus Heimdallarchaeota archaeon]|nr:zinc-ribbon domain-containing protein [Candidatus Heimdallarchaeota archaeon]